MFDLLFFYPEDGASIFFRNFAEILLGYTASYPENIILMTMHKQ
jgi:hypothetical protein